MADMGAIVDVAKWYETQAGVAALTLGAVAIAEGFFIKFLLNNFRADIKEAFRQAKECADQRHADAMIGQAALGENTKLLAIMNVQLQPDRRHTSR